MSLTSELREDFNVMSEARARADYLKKFLKDYKNTHILTTILIYSITFIYLPIGFILSLPFLPFVTVIDIPFEWGGKWWMDMYLVLQLFPLIKYEDYILSISDWEEYKKKTNYKPFDFEELIVETISDEIDKEIQKQIVREQARLKSRVIPKYNKHNKKYKKYKK